MKRKNIRLIVFIILLLAVNLIFWTWKPDYERLNYNPERFTILDTASVEKIVLTGKEGENTLARSGSGWVLNGEYPVDENLKKILLSVLNKVRIKRELSEEEIKEVKRSQGHETKVNVEGVDISPFTVKGNANLTKTYFLEGDAGFEVEIPGYSDYVGGVFQLTRDQWRDRMVFSGNWRSIQELVIDYQGLQLQDLKIDFEGDFFMVEGIQEIDSNRVVEYLDNYLFLQANERISKGRFDRYDSLMKTTPDAVISIDDIKSEQTVRFSIFPPLEGERLRLVVDDQSEMMVFDRRRLELLFATPADFKYE